MHSLIVSAHIPQMANSAALGQRHERNSEIVVADKSIREAPSSGDTPQGSSPIVMSAEENTHVCYPQSERDS